jgi:hypothetical protein
MRDERLCWLAVRDELQRRAGRRFGVRLLYLSGALWNRDRHEAENAGLAAYSFPVSDAAAKLSPEEREVLRSTGQVPPWFLAEVERLRRTAGR